MRHNPKIAIVIPVYNRAEFVARSLEIHVPQAEKHGVAIYISDNCSQDNTREIVEAWVLRSPCVFYSCNDTNIGADRNFEAALRLPATEYVWLLGDTYELPDNAIDHVLKLLGTSVYDAIVINLENKVPVKPQVYSNRSELLGDLCRVISCLSCLIYSKKIILGGAFDRYYDSYFIQTGIMLEYIAARDFLVFWAGDISVGVLSSARLKKTSWVDTPRVAEIGVEKWVNFIFSLPPQYDLLTKLKAARNFGLLSWRGIVVMRANGFLTPGLIARHKASLSFALDSKVKYYSLFVISRLPIWGVKFGVESLRKIRRQGGF